WIELDPQVEAAKHGRPDLRTRVLEREVPVAGRGAGEVRYLTRDPDRGIVRLDESLQPRHQRRDRELVGFQLRSGGHGVTWRERESADRPAGHASSVPNPGVRREGDPP